MGKLMIGNNVVTPVIVNGSPTPSGKYTLLQRISDDSNNEIGAVVGFFIDANDTEYAIVGLYEQYWGYSLNWSSSKGAVTNLPQYNTRSDPIDLMGNTYTDTATSNCDKILAWCTSNNYTSQAVSHCRSQSFVIDGTTYYAQLPNLCELFYLCLNRTAIGLNYTINPSWSSSQYDSTFAWSITNAAITGVGKNSTQTVYPVLELPNS